MQYKIKTQNNLQNIEGKTTENSDSPQIKALANLKASPANSSRKKDKFKSKRLNNIGLQKINKKKLISSVQMNLPEIKMLISKVSAALKNDFLITPGSKLIVAVSGGVDSVVLLDLLANISYSENYELAIAHFNHNLRGRESDGDEEFVKKLSEDYNIRFYCSSGNVKKYTSENSCGIEQAARQLRYAFLERTAQSFGATHIATGHTFNDSAETFLLNLIRGSGFTGLSGISPLRNMNNNFILIRPLLGVKKENLIEYARCRKLNWREDSSNNLAFYLRNRIRNELIPLLQENYSPAIIEVLSRTANLFRKADEFLNDYIRSMFPSLIRHKKNYKFAVKISLLQTCNEFIQGEIIQKALLHYFKLLPLSLNMIERILGLMSSQSGSTIEINKDYLVVRDRSYLTFLKQQPKIEINRLLEIPGEYNLDTFTITFTKLTKKQVKFTDDKNIEYLDFDLLPSVLNIRNWVSGDSFQPLGMEGTIKISDFLINEKVPVTEKKNIVILSAASEIIWVCGLRLSEKYKITDLTRNFLKAEIST